MKNQEFKTMVTNAINALEMQGEVCKNRTGYCVYLNRKGMCCIVGHMMPNDETRESAGASGDTTIDGLAKIDFPWCESFGYEQIRTLTILQNIHDNHFYPAFDERINVMREVAAQLPTEEEEC